jgi:nucleolar protein 56
MYTDSQRSVQKQDNHIIQAIATLDQIDKDLNTFCMRLRENYGIFLHV